MTWATTEDALPLTMKKEELEGNCHYNYACDAIEAMVMGHAIAGVNIEGPAYLEGLESAIDGVANNI